MRFQVHTVYDAETVQELQNTIREAVPEAQKRAVRRNFLLAGTACLAGALFLGLQNSLMAVVPLMCGVLLLFNGICFHSSLAVRREKEKKRQQDTAPSESMVSLEEDFFQVSNKKGDALYPYSGCKELLENQRHFILMLDSQHAVALDKNGIQNGTAEELRAFLQEKTGKTFRGPDRTTSF